MESMYRKVNLLTGWGVFLLAAVVYLVTLEPTVSFWDCGEFIAAGYKLEVGHPPGAPVFMLLARFFSLFAGGEVSKVAWMVNAMSGLASAFTILFLFWTITHMGRKMMGRDAALSAGNIIALMGAGATGALAYTFSDTFWFSAVEGEVYALSSLFTAIVFWAILKWENVADQPAANRWLIFIAFLMGLSIGVHLLNLLAIPAIVFVYYFRKYPVTRKGVFYAALVSVVLLAVILYLIIPGFVRVASWFELIFVNTLGLPYMSGMIFYVFAVFALLAYLLYYTVKRNMVVVNTVVLGLTVILIGYLGYAVIPIRSLANPPMDENNPDDPFSLMYYLNREQYGDRPLVYGQYYSAPVIDIKDKSPWYVQRDGKYVITHYTSDYVFDPRFETLFPRMWSNRAEHTRAYEEWGRVKGQRIRVNSQGGEAGTRVKPTFGENLRFFFSYQLGHMYFRYFMWNFSGRQNDIQGHGDILKGNWLTGIKFLDEARLGPQTGLPGRYDGNAASNRYYMLPLLLGLAGLLLQYRYRSYDFWVVMLLFVLTGIAIVVYLNQYPYQPRERDYAYAGSFYAFSVWIGLGVAGLFRLLAEKIPRVTAAVTLTLVSLALVPGIMAAENWDDHDRSGRYTARDVAFNYLNTCEKNAILFTNGDNDTFPLWYAQEVEGVRTDVRVVNMMLFMTDWYVDQIKRKAYDSPPVKFTLKEEKYQEGTNTQILVRELFKRPLNMREVLDWINSNDPRTKLQTQDGEMLDYIPTRTIRIPVDSARVVENGTVPPELASQIEPYLEIRLKGNYLLKNQLMMLDLLSSNNWERPVYYVTGGHDDAMGLERYFQLEGFAYRLVPIKTPMEENSSDFGRIHTEKLYKNLMENFQWGNMNDPDVYLDYTNLHTFSVIRLRKNFVRLANSLTEQGDPAGAETVLDRVMELMPHEKVPYDHFVMDIIRAYYKCGADEKADDLLDEMARLQAGDLDYFLGLDTSLMVLMDYETRVALQSLQECALIARSQGKDERAERFNELLNGYYTAYAGKVGIQ